MARPRPKDEWYLGDPREGCIRPDGRIMETDNKSGSDWDGTEVRYYWNGAYLNIGEQSPADYATTVFFVSGGSSCSCSGSSEDIEPITDQDIDDIINGHYNGAKSSSYSFMDSLFGGDEEEDESMTNEDINNILGI